MEMVGGQVSEENEGSEGESRMVKMKSMRKKRDIERMKRDDRAKSG